MYVGMAFSALTSNNNMLSPPGHDLPLGGVFLLALVLFVCALLLLDFVVLSPPCLSQKILYIYLARIAF